MMYPTIEELYVGYRNFVAWKKNSPTTADAAVLFNQQILMAAGKIHKACSAEQYQEFIETTFSGAYYNQWRKERAVGVAHLDNMCKRLNVHFGLDDYRGETFYAGIPPITQDELDSAKKAADDAKYKFWPVSEKIGIDGIYHPVGEDGEFHPLLDENDIYGDGSCVTLKDLRDLTKGE